MMQKYSTTQRSSQYHHRKQAARRQTNSHRPHTNIPTRPAHWRTVSGSHGRTLSRAAQDEPTHTHTHSYTFTHTDSLDRRLLPLADPDRPDTPPPPCDPSAPPPRTVTRLALSQPTPPSASPQHSTPNATQSKPRPHHTDFARESTPLRTRFERVRETRFESSDISRSVMALRRAYYGDCYRKPQTTRDSRESSQFTYRHSPHNAEQNAHNSRRSSEPLANVLTKTDAVLTTHNGPHNSRENPRQSSQLRTE